MKLILIRSPQLFFYKMKSKKKIKNMTIQLQFYTITITNGRKAAGNLIVFILISFYFSSLREPVL